MTEIADFMSRLMIYGVLLPMIDMTLRWYNVLWSPDA